MRYVEFKTRIAERVVGETSSDIVNTLSGIWTNTAIKRIAGEEYWHDLATKDQLTLTADYSTGTVTVTNGSTTVTGSGSTWTASMVGRKFQTSGDGTATTFEVATFVSTTSITININYDGTGGAGKSYTILSPEDYTLPYDYDKGGIFWHEILGYPLLLRKVTQRKFYEEVYDLNSSGTPRRYRLWEGSSILAQPAAASTINVVSSSTGDNTQTVRIYGLVSSYPDAENLSLNGTTTATSTKSFSRVDRVSISSGTANLGRITISDSTNSVTLAVIPVGGINESMKLRKIWLYPRSKDADTLEMFYYRRTFLLTNDNDVPDFGPEFDEAIILYASYLGKQYQQHFQESEIILKNYKDEIRRLRSENNDPIGLYLTLESRLTSSSAFGQVTLTERSFPIPEP